MRTYTLSWIAILIIGVVLTIFEDLSQLLGPLLVLISGFALFQKKDQLEIKINPNKEKAK